MPIICYDENSPRTGSVVPYNRINATDGYLRHYANYLYLSFIFNNTDDWREKQQANKELTICQRKMDYHRKHPNFNAKHAEAESVKLKAQWEQKPNRNTSSGSK
jgi:hypothetical protein